MQQTYMPCPDLSPKEYCFVGRQYFDGEFTQFFHLHVAKHRLSKENALNLLKTLAARFWGKTGMGADQIVQNYLNSHGCTPPADTALKLQCEHSEPGVLRTYCGGNTQIWLDEVVSKELFRTERGEI
jgi:hypothetical protein